MRLFNTAATWVGWVAIICTIAGATGLADFRMVVGPKGTLTDCKVAK